MIHASTQALASAYLFKSNFSVLIPTIRETARGVTPQAQLICSALLAPLTNAERSVLLRILGEDVSLHSSSKTISNQQTGILRKLDLPGRRELTHIFKAYGFQKRKTVPFLSEQRKKQPCEIRRAAFISQRELLVVGLNRFRRSTAGNEDLNDGVAAETVAAHGYRR